MAAWTAACVGLALFAGANVEARAGKPHGQALFWLGTLLMFAPIAWRITAARGVTRAERITLAVGFGVLLYLAKLSYSPTRFVFHDEFAHVRTSADILRTHALFSLNPEIRVASHYPGLALVTDGLARLSGLSVFASGAIVVGAARVVLQLGLFLLVERLTRSTRAAALTACLYAANANFLYWSAQFAYESLALPLAVAALYLLSERDTGKRGFAAAATIVLAMVVVTHHLTSIVLTAVLLAWSAVGLLRRREGPAYAPLAPALMLTALTAAWLVFAAPRTIGYLGPVFDRALSQGWSLVSTGHGNRTLFANAGGPVAPAWERALAVATQVTIVALLPFALLRRRRSATRPSLTSLLVWSSLLYAALQPLRLTSGGQELANRSGDFLFVGIGVALALLVVEHRLPLRILRQRATAALLATFLFAGGTAVSWSFAERLAPRAAAARGVPVVATADDLAAARWLLRTYGRSNRVATDVTTGLAFTAAGQDVLSGASFGSHVWRIFEPTTMTASVYDELSRSRVRFVVVQRRLSEGLPPAGGITFDSGEPGSIDRRPVPRASLLKFSAARGLEQVYASGTIGIYRVTEAAR